MSRAETKRVVIQIEDWIDRTEAWEEDILMFMNYGRDLLGFLKQQHPDTPTETDTSGELSMPHDKLTGTTFVLHLRSESSSSSRRHEKSRRIQTMQDTSGRKQMTKHA